MKKKIKNTLSPLQRRRFVKIIALLLIAAVAWLVFAPEMGLYSLHQEKAKLERLQQRKAELEKENAALRREIERINSDIEYLEKLAREKHGLLKKNETVFDFGAEKGD